MTPEEEPAKPKSWDWKDTPNYKDAVAGCDNCRNQRLDSLTNDTIQKKKSGKMENLERSTDKKFRPQLKWPDLIGLLFVHLGCLYGLYLLVASRSLKNFIWRK